MTIRDIYRQWRLTHDWRDVRDATIVIAFVIGSFIYVWRMFSLPKAL